MIALHFCLEGQSGHLWGRKVMFLTSEGLRVEVAAGGFSRLHLRFRRTDCSEMANGDRHSLAVLLL
jgi:hypothetical protein